MLELFQDVIILARDTGMSERERALSYPYGKPGLEQSNHP